MSRGRFEVRGISKTIIAKTIIEHTAIKCADSSHPARYTSPSGNCHVCAHKWPSSLPFNRPFGRPYGAEDDLLKTQFRIADEVEWQKEIIKDIWNSEGSEWRGYTVEFFGPKVGERANPDEYPYWRIQNEQNPSLIIPLLRTRVCYEPQKERIPIYLEVRYDQTYLTSAIRGMDADIEVGPKELQYLLRARDRMLNLSSPSIPHLRRGGRNNMKVAGLSEDIKKALGKRYVELQPSLTKVKQDAKAFASATDDWQQLILKKYPILKIHPDLLNRIDPYGTPQDADASDGIVAPWEIAIEISARDTIPDYQRNSVTSESLKTAAILPSKG